MQRRKEKQFDIYEVVARNIKRYRKYRGITQAELAEKTECSHEFIKRIEVLNSKKNFSLDTVSNIVDALDIDIELLFAKSDKELEKQP